MAQLRAGMKREDWTPAQNAVIRERFDRSPLLTQREADDLAKRTGKSQVAVLAKWYRIGGKRLHRRRKREPEAQPKPPMAEGVRCSELKIWQGFQHQPSGVCAVSPQQPEGVCAG